MPKDQLLKIDVIEHLFILLPDGCKLAAKIWLPSNASKNPVPAILEYLPYRKRDGTAWRDQITHPTKMSSSMTATETHYELKATLRAYQSEQLVIKREWNTTILRDKAIMPPSQTLSQFFKSQITKDLSLEPFVPTSKL